MISVVPFLSFWEWLAITETPDHCPTTAFHCVGKLSQQLHVGLCVLVAAGFPSSCFFPTHLLHFITPMQQGKGFGITTATMDLTIKGWNGVKDTVELGEDDTPAVMRRKVASAVGLPEDGFAMSFGGVAMDEGYDMTQLSAGDTIVLSTTKKFEARAALHALGETDITAQRLKTVQDPEVACLLLQAEVATVIPDEFLRRASLTSLDLSAESVVTQIGSCFLRHCTSLTSINLSGLIHVTHIANGFLLGCKSLRTLDLSPLSSVSQMGTCFLAGCSSLCSLDLSPLSSVTEINCLTKINHSFLGRCTSLRSIYLTGCSDVVSSTVRNCLLKEFVVESRPKRSRDEPLEESPE